MACGVALFSSVALLGVLFAGALFCMTSLLLLLPEVLGVCANTTALASSAAARLNVDIGFMV
jgi:hypothetical protein